MDPAAKARPGASDPAGGPPGHPPRPLRPDTGLCDAAQPGRAVRKGPRPADPFHLPRPGGRRGQGGGRIQDRTVRPGGEGAGGRMAVGRHRLCPRTLVYPDSLGEGKLDNVPDNRAYDVMGCAYRLPQDEAARRPASKRPRRAPGCRVCALLQRSALGLHPLPGPGPCGPGASGEGEEVLPSADHLRSAAQF